MTDGGPAFPAQKVFWMLPRDFETRFPGAEQALQEIRVEGTGMSLRDWFAGMALQGLLAHSCKNDLPIWKVADAATRAYEMADALLAEHTWKETT